MRPMNFFEFSLELKDRYDSVARWNEVLGNYKVSTLELQLCLMAEEFEEYRNATTRKEIIKELIDYLVVTSYAEKLTNLIDVTHNSWVFEMVGDGLNSATSQAFILQRMGFNILLAFDMVIESNYSKFDNYRDDMLDKYDEHCKYLEKDGRYSNVKWEQVVDYVVYRSGEGKLLKGRNYQEADLSWLEAA